MIFSRRLTSLWMMLMFTTLFVTVGCEDDPSKNGADVNQASARAKLSDEELRDLLDEVLTFTFTERQLNLKDNAAWQILHGALPYGQKFKVLNEDGEKVPVFDWVFGGNPMTGWTLLPGAKNLSGGRRGLKAVLESGSKTGQGHEDQWIAVIAQSGYPSEHKVKFRGQKYQVGDIVLQAMHDVYEGKECSWSLIAITSYLGPNVEWTNSVGEDWSIDRMIGMEADQNINMSACGGSHRLIGMTMALKEYQRVNNVSHDQLTGNWQKANKKIKDSIVAASKFQHPNGTFSTDYFRGKGTSQDLLTKINKSGHTLEFLVLAIEQEHLQEDWIVNAVVDLCEMFKHSRRIDLECGGLYHATHGLMEYRERRFGKFTYPGEESAVATEDLKKEPTVEAVTPVTSDSSK